MSLREERKPPAGGHRALPRRRRLAAGAAWAAIVQYFVLLVVVQAAWTEPYSPVRNAISDLGAVSCGPYSGREVCSPWHVAANVSWVVAGLSICGGLLLVRPVFGRAVRARVGTVLLLGSGVGLTSVELHLEDASALHVPSAVAAIGLGLPAIVLLGSTLTSVDTYRAVGWLGIALGATGLAGLALAVVTPHRLFGLFERIAAYPILIWMIVVGVTTLVHAIRGREHAGAEHGGAAAVAGVAGR